MSPRYPKWSAEEEHCGRCANMADGAVRTPVKRPMADFLYTQCTSTPIRRRVAQGSSRDTDGSNDGGLCTSAASLAPVAHRTEPTATDSSAQDVKSRLLQRLDAHRHANPLRAGARSPTRECAGAGSPTTSLREKLEGKLTSSKAANEVASTNEDTLGPDCGASEQHSARRARRGRCAVHPSKCIPGLQTARQGHMPS